MIRKLPDFELWSEVAKSVKPLRRRGTKKASLATAVEGPRPTPKISAPHSHIPRAVAKLPPPITGFDRRTAQKLTRGNVDIESRFDLHGTGVEIARVRLLQFLRQSQAQGQRTVLVITGKGESPYARHTLHGSSHFHAPERQGRLRRLVPEWLHEAEFRSLVSGFQPAHPKHGGGGAYYVRMRRTRERS
ncbi:MAG: Smr/MutS family protein [Hyphomicrobiales bacterium]